MDEPTTLNELLTLDDMIGAFWPRACQSFLAAICET